MAFYEPVFIDTRPRDRIGWPDIWAMRRRMIGLRKKAQMSQKRLGGIVGLNRRTISRTENGHTTLGPRNWKQVEALEKAYKQIPREFPKNWFDEA